MAADTSRASQDRYDVDSDNEIDLDDEPELEDLPRDVDLSKRAGVKKQLADLFDDVERGFSDQADRADNIQDFWSVYNCELNGNQFYNGNSQIFVPIVKNAVDARKTRYVNQMFPRSGRNVAVTSADGEQPWGMMSLLEHYIQKAQLRTQVMPALMVSGDVEGQYNLYVSWEERERHVTWRGFKVPEVDGVPNPAAGEIEDIHEEIITDCVPVTEVLADTDVLVLPATSNSIPEAIAAGGSVTIIRRWTRAKIEQMAREGYIREDAAQQLVGLMSEDPSEEKRVKKMHLEAAGIHNDGGSKYALVYQTWSNIKVKGKRRLCLSFYGGEDIVLGCRRNPLWSDKVPVLSAPVAKSAGSFKGISKVQAVAPIQYFANDAVNEAADSAAYALMPIVMTDPAKNPRVGSMVLSLAAVWETSPQDTQFAEFPQLWQHGFEMVAAAKAEVAQTLSVSPAAITGGGGASKSKPSQAEIAQEQQIDILTTGDAVTIVEEGILTPWLELVVEMDHQYRKDDLWVTKFGRMGVSSEMERVPPIQMGTRYQYKWFGVEQARAAQQIQQQIAGMNVIRGIPPDQLGGYKINLVPVVRQLVENTFGPRLAPLIFESPAEQMPVPVDQENILLLNGYEVPVHDMDNDMEHIQAHGALLQGPQGAGTGKKDQQIKAHIWAHMQQLQRKQAAALQVQQGAPGIPGGAIGGQAQPGVAGTPRIGAQPAQATGGQGPPGSIHQDQLQDPAVFPRMK